LDYLELLDAIVEDQENLSTERNREWASALVDARARSRKFGFRMQLRGVWDRNSKRWVWGSVSKGSR
jgi:hypothetical protein